MYRRDLCILCSACTDQCPTHALEAVGMMLTVSEVMHELLCDRAFYASSGGGVTLSGGEPTFQHDFTEALLRACKAEGLHTCLETCLFTTEDTVKKLRVK